MNLTTKKWTKSVKPRVTTKAKVANWVDVVLFAEAEGLPFGDVHFITLKERFKELAFERALTDHVYAQLTDQQFDETIRKVVAAGTVSVCEFIHIHPDYQITVCVDAPEISDDVIDKALETIMGLDIEPNTIVDMSAPRTFTVEEIYSDATN